MDSTLYIALEDGENGILRSIERLHRLLDSLQHFMSSMFNTRANHPQQTYGVARTPSMFEEARRTVPRVDAFPMTHTRTVSPSLSVFV